MEVKQGWKTTEFWISTVTALLGLGVLMGLVSQAEASEVIASVEKITGGLMTLGSVAAYALSRGRAKGTDTAQIAKLVDVLSKVAKGEEK